MGRHKEIREYTVKLNHPVLGDFYFNYTSDLWTGSGSIYRFYFTKDLKKVRTWKTKKSVENQIDYINTRIQGKNHKHIIILRLNEAQSKLVDNVLIVRKKPYLEIRNIVSPQYLKKTEDELKKINTKISENIVAIQNMLDYKIFNEELWGRVRNLKKDSEKMRDHSDYIKESENPITMDIVDASFGFRFLKLKTLKNFQPGLDEDEETEDEETDEMEIE